MRMAKFSSKLAIGVATAVIAVVTVACAPVQASQFKTAADYNAQTVKWTSCGSSLYCGLVVVPLDWSKPAGATIKIAVDYHKASVSKPLGSVIFNPGGPGASGYDYVKSSISSLGTETLRANYNFVGFDPRGVQNSVPAVHCYVPSIGAASSKMDQFLYGDSGYSYGSAKDLAASKKVIKAFSDACYKNTGKLLSHLDTVSTARDLDVIRAVMGDAKLNYLGYSYGTFIGVNYASLFPTKVGRMVLDGAVDPTVSDAQQSFNQLKGFDLALRDYLTDCLANNGCPFTGTVSDALTKIKTFLRGVETSPLTSTDGNRKVTIAMATTGINMALYSKDYWSYLTQAFKAAFKGDGTILLRLADFYNDRNSDGTYNSNETEAFISTSCMDGRQSSSMKSMQAQNKALLAASPVMGRYWQYGGLSCAYWHYPVSKPLKSYAAKGSPAIVVVGTTGDPATPYQQAVHLANGVLANGFLITYNGEGHTVYGQGHDCVDNAVDAFYTAGTLPNADPQCR
jgi:pimeloyl-ACP methyl ester carboxylesterase